MTHRDEDLPVSDMEIITDFVVTNDHAGMKKWLHTLPLDRVRAIHKTDGAVGPFAKIITERYQLLLSEQSAHRPHKHWYVNVIKIVVGTIVTGSIGLSVRAVLMHYFPQWFH